MLDYLERESVEKVIRLFPSKMQVTNNFECGSLFQQLHQ
jgi:hypothetical protein